MNANELADEFKEENNDWNEDNLRHWGKQTEAMLRQQQAEIEALKSVVYWLKENRPEVWEDIKKWRKL